MVISLPVIQFYLRKKQTNIELQTETVDAEVRILIGGKIPKVDLRIKSNKEILFLSNLND